MTAHEGKLQLIINYVTPCQKQGKKKRIFFSGLLCKFIAMSFFKKCEGKFFFLAWLRIFIRKYLVFIFVASLRGRTLGVAS